MPPRNAPFACCVDAHPTNSDGISPLDEVCSAAARVARKFAYSFCGWPACPRTQRHAHSCAPSTATASCHSARFSIGPVLRVQLRFIHDGTHCVIPSTMYLESLVN